MTSVALQDWLSSRASRLDELEVAHQSLGGTGPGRRYATQQINQAYAVLLSAQFQGFCRDLYTESAEAIVQSIAIPTLLTPLRIEFSLNQRLSRGNPNPGNIGADYGRFGLEFWKEVDAIDSRNTQRKRSLEELNIWRNAIAHQDFDATILGGTSLQLKQVRSWRSACDGLATGFYRVMFDYLCVIIGRQPW